MTDSGGGTERSLLPVGTTRQTLAHRIDHYFNVPAIPASALLLLLGWAEVTGQIGMPWQGAPAALFWIIWGFFILEYVVKFLLALDKKDYLQKHWVALLSGLLPFLGVLRLFRIVPAIGHLRRPHFAILRRRRIGQLTLTSVLVTVLAAIAELLLEQHAKGSTITNFTDALYWSASTTTTVGSQFTPVSTGGYIVSVLLMLYGVAVFMYFMSAVASVLIGGDAQEEASATRAADVRAIERATQAAVQPLRTGGPPRVQGPDAASTIERENESDIDVLRRDIALLRKELAELRELLELRI